MISNAPEFIEYRRLLVVRLPQHSHLKPEAVGLEAQQALEEGFWVLVVFPTVRPRDFQDAVAAVTRIFDRLMAKDQGEVDHTSLGLDLSH